MKKKKKPEKEKSVKRPKMVRANNTVMLTCVLALAMSVAAVPVKVTFVQRLVISCVFLWRFLGKPRLVKFQLIWLDLCNTLSSLNE